MILVIPFLRMAPDPNRFPAPFSFFEGVLDYMILLQQLFHIGAFDLLQHLFHRHPLLEAQVHLGERSAVPEADGGFQQIPDVIEAAPDLGHASIHVEEGVDSHHSGTHGIFSGKHGIPLHFGKLAQEGKVHRSFRHHLGPVALGAGHEVGAGEGHHGGHRVGAVGGQLLDLILGHADVVEPLHADPCRCSPS